MEYEVLVPYTEQKQINNKNTKGLYDWSTDEPKNNKR